MDITAPAQIITAPAQHNTAPAQPPATGVVVYTALFSILAHSGVEKTRKKQMEENRKKRTINTGKERRG